MDGKSEGGPKKPLKKKTGAPKVTNPSADPLVQPAVNPAPKPVKRVPAVSPTVRPVSQPLPRPVPKPMNTAPAKDRVIAPSITSFTPARAHVNPAPAAKPVTQVTTVSAPAKPTMSNDVIKPETEVKSAPVQAAESDTKQLTDTILQPIEEKPAKKTNKKKIALFSAIGCAVIALGALATFLTITLLNTDNRVAIATAKLFSNERPRYVRFNGKITNSLNDNGTDTTNTIAIDSGFDYTTKAFQLNSNVLLDADSGNEISYKFSETKDESGNYYIDFSSIENLITSILNTIVVENESSTDGNDELVKDGTTVVTEDLIVKATQSLGEKWVQVNSDEAENMATTSFGGGQFTVCWTKALQSLPNLGANAKTLYDQNPFISYKTSDLSITAKANRLYRLYLDDEKMADFANSMPDATVIRDLLGCIGSTPSNNITALDIARALPTSLVLYVEIDDNYDFTRLYIEYTDTDGTLVKADLDITYPDNFTVAAPSEFITLADFTNALVEATQPEEPAEPEEPVIDNGDWYDPGYYEDTTIITDDTYYDDPAQDIDPSGSGGNYDPGF